MAVRVLLLLIVIANILVLVLSTDDHNDNEGALEKTSKGHGRSPYSSPSGRRQGHSKTKSRRCRRGSKCKKGEEFSACVQSIGRPQYCSDNNQKISTTETNDASCRKGCVCKVDYLRAENGTCIPKDQCEVKCGDNEVLNNCPGPCDSDYCPKKENENADCVGAAVCLKPACTCAFNHRRAENGTCIPTKSCPPFDCSARPNEEFNPCPPLCPTDDCSQASPTGRCPRLLGRIGIVLTCNPKCRCIKGYWRKNGTCVPYGQCPGVCPANERYSECIQGECIALNCDQKDQSIPCPRIKPENCLKGCVCEENYLRAANGTCVPQDQCEINACPIHEEYVACVQGVCRAMNCSEKGNVCPPNEQWSECKQARCRAENCTQRGKPIACPGIAEGDCIEGCVCQENYLRDANGVCVPEDQCPGEVKCGDNEVLNNCPGPCDSDYCPKKENENVDCVGAAVCLKPACECAFNHRRADNGTCIPTTSCPPFDCSARPNEEFNPCPPLCPTDDCSQASPSGKCPLFGRIGIVLPCDPTCRCIKGYWRNNGTCVPYGQCPGVCPANERYSECIQGECIALNCDQKDQSIPCPRIKPENCLKGCVCEENYLRAANGTCVLKDQCESNVCPTNEQWSECTQARCRAENCAQRGKPIACAIIAEGGCIEGCVCQDNYLRDENGVCVPEDQCPGEVKCGDNEVLNNCPGPCDSDNCPKKENENADCVGAAVCLKPACECAFNHRRADNGTCIPTTSCPPFDCSARPNEEFNPCPPLCPTDDCSQASPTGKCPLFGRIGIVLTCNPKCRCIKGYWRNNGTCVPYGQCPGVCPANERYSECIQGECIALNCDQKDQSIPCPRIKPENCLKGCVCEENYLRAANGTCVPKDQCEINACPINEEYVTCVQGVCRAMNCSQKGQDVPCPDIPKEICNSGCICKERFLRNEDGTCVPEDQCQSNVCPPNEQWSECTQARCRAENCAQRGKPIACPGIAEGSCIEGCVCQDNYLRDENGVCVPEDQCPGEVKCGDNEVLNNCPGSCDSDYCPKKENENADCVGAAVCLKPACECAFNHRRADNGTCIPTTSCPPFDCSARPNEEFNPCPPLCPTDDCSQASPTGKCPLFGRIGIVLPCDPTCRCIKGYWRNNGTCVPYGQCPGVCPANERYSECIQGECIALNCDQKDQSIPCPRIKPENCLKGCVCEENYLRAVNGKCVPKDQCETDVCPPNEIWGDCTQQECRAQLCFQKGIPVPCPGHVAGRYTEGCVCQEKYIRDENGVCIPADQYYAGLCSVNEEYTTCTQAVGRPTNCSQRRHEVDYSDIYEPCEDGCVCKENFLRNAEGNCVPEDKCGNITCFENEVLDPCSQDCISDYCSSLPDLEEHCYKPETCKPQCKCRFNYRRSYNGTCIETRDCPPFDCTDRPNEEYNSCPAYCPTDECSLARVKGECPFKIGVVLECQPQCQCIEGYGRVNGTCVPYEECPDLCPINEEYSSCVQATCRAQNCTDRDALLPCPAFGAASCKKGCICKKNYYRNEIGKCVSYEQCAGPICPDENEEYTSTKRGCPPNTCVSLVARFKCDENQKVEPGCVCQSGYLRLNETSPCIPICQCPQMANSFDCIGKHSNNYTLIGDEAKTISEV